MDSGRFDALTRSVASRRSIMARAGAGGFGALLFGARAEAASSATCVLNVRLFVRLGPSAGFLIVPKSVQPGQLTGKLHLSISSKGELTGSTFILSDGTSFPVIGDVSAHLLAARVTLAKDQVMVLQGVGEQAVHACQGAIDGGLVGPREGDLGDWHAIAEPAGATPTATAASNGSQQTVTTPVPAGPTQPSALESPTLTPAAPTDTATSTPLRATSIPVVCPECQELQRGVVTSPGCAPVADDTPCSSGLCCGGVCGDLSNNPNHCGSCANVCQSACCQAGACCILCGSGQTDCGGTCVDLTGDLSNCGSCGNACTTTETCSGGVCVKKHITCPPGQINCGGTCFAGKNCP